MSHYTNVLERPDTVLIKIYIPFFKFL